MGRYQPQRFGHSPRDVEIAESDHRASIAALLHPSFRGDEAGSPNAEHASPADLTADLTNVKN